MTSPRCDPTARALPIDWNPNREVGLKMRQWHPASAAAAVALVAGLIIGGPARAQDPVTVVLKIQGGAMEGHTPRGFRGRGTGLFAGDNLNPGLLDGDGVQIFLTFDLRSLPKGEIRSAVLRSDSAHIQGNPFRDLGALRAEEIRYRRFSPALWNDAPGSASCIFADSRAGPFACEITEAVQRARAKSDRHAQFRLRMDKAGDGDGRPDMVMFFKTNSNTNEPGIFELAVSVKPETPKPKRSRAPATEAAPM